MAETGKERKEGEIWGIEKGEGKDMGFKHNNVLRGAEQPTSTTNTDADLRQDPHGEDYSPASKLLYKCTANAAQLYLL